MLHDTLDTFVASGSCNVLPAGPIGIVLCESNADSASTAQRLAAQGAVAVIIVGEHPPEPELSVPMMRLIAVLNQNTVASILNRLIDTLSGRWILWVWNGEYFFFPFGETRMLSDLTTFLTEERRPSVFTYALDLYGHDLPADDMAPDTGLYFDRQGYHGFGGGEHPLKLYGGLGWRFEELIGAGMQQIGRASLFRAERGVYLDRELVFEDRDYAAVSCPWHHNPTAAVMSLRRSRRLMAHKRFPELRDKLIWAGSEQFDWTDQQLLRLGMIEPGQWF